jgi:hypothetical protein
VTGKNGRSGISFLFGIIPIRLIAFELKVELACLHLGFLQAEEIGIQALKLLPEFFIATGTNAVYIP